MTKNPSFRLILLLTLLCFSNAVFAEKGKGCTETVIVVDTIITQTQ
jgi:hypothetical protein